MGGRVRRAVVVAGWAARCATVVARVRAAPFEGQANTALCRLLADVLDTAPRQVTLVAGSNARLKRIRIAGAANAIVEKLQRLAKVAS